MGENIINSEGEVLEIEEKNWEKVVEKNKLPVLVMFSSKKCPNCTQMIPYFIDYSIEYKGKVVFVKLDIINNMSISQKYGVMGTPTFKFFCKGHPVQEIVGAVYPPLLKKLIDDGFLYGKDCVDKTTWIPPSITGYQ